MEIDVGRIGQGIQIGRTVVSFEIKKKKEIKDIKDLKEFKELKELKEQK